MALIDKASLLMVPSTYEAGTLYNVLPSGNRAPDSTDQNSGYDQTRADFDFDRGSNAAATRVNASGLIEKYRENILLRSNDFDTTWTDFSGASAQSGYDGNSNAWRYDSSSSALRLQQVGISISGVKTYSIYAKYVDAQWFSLQIDGASTEAAWFDIQNGTLGTTTNAIDSKIEAVGTDGWYRCSVTGSVDSQNRVRLYVVGSDGSSTTITGSIYIQNAQLEKGMVASSYLESTSVTGKAGVLVDLPRINYDANGQNGSLLLEPSRANLITQSEYFDGWSGFRTDLSANSATSPEGVFNAYSMVPNTDNNTHFIYFNTSESAVDYSFSLFAKSNGQQWIQLAKGGGGYANFDLSNGVKGNYGTDGSSAFNDSDIEDFGNGWYRITGYYTSVGGASNIAISAINSNVTGRYQSFAGDGTSGYYIYGAQFEAGNYVSSYIPTMGTSETRAADSCSVTGASDVIGQTEGTLFVEASAIDNESTNKRISLSDGTNANRVTLNFGLNQIGFVVVVSNVASLSTTYTISPNANHKIALAYKQNDFVAYIDGVQVLTDNSGATFSGALNSFRFSDGQSGLSLFAGDTKQAALFKERLSNTELATLTTL